MSNSLQSWIVCARRLCESAFLGYQRCCCARTIRATTYMKARECSLNRTLDPMQMVSSQGVDITKAAFTAVLWNDPNLSREHARVASRSLPGRPQTISARTTVRQLAIRS